MPLRHRGINYDTGINYAAGSLSRPGWDAAAVGRDLDTIAGTLHCTAVNVFGSDLDRVASCARMAAERGLDVWIQPRLIDRPPAEVLDHLQRAAEIAERLRRSGATVLLHVGCELSVFLPGVVPGADYPERIARLIEDGPSAEQNRRLNDHLAQARSRARAAFGGPVGYAAGEWEAVDWSGFDVVGMNLYREDANAAHYVDTLRGLRAHGRPAVVTEFGCCAYAGADSAGGAGHELVDFDTDPPTVDPAIPRDEALQAAHLAEMIELYRREDLDGCFVYAFSEPTNPYSDDPRHDLDKASYGVVRTLRDPAGTGARWEPKAAFTQLARSYGALAASGAPR